MKKKRQQKQIKQLNSLLKDGCLIWHFSPFTPLNILVEINKLHQYLMHDCIFMEHFAYIRGLSLAHNKITANGMATLSSAKWMSLQTLDLSRNKIRSIGCKYLSKIPNSLTLLRLIDNQIGQEGLKHLIKAPWISLRQIWLSGNYLCADSFKQIVKANWIKIAQLLFCTNQTSWQHTAIFNKKVLFVQIKIHFQEILFFLLSFQTQIQGMFDNKFYMKAIFNHLIDVKAKQKISQSSISQCGEYAYRYFDKTMQRLIDWIGLITSSSFVEQSQVSMMLCQIAVLINVEFQSSAVKFSLEKVEIEPEKSLYQYVQEIAGIVYDFIYSYFGVKIIDFEKAKSLSYWSFFFQQKYSPKLQIDAVKRFQVKMSSLRSKQTYSNQAQEADVKIINEFQRNHYAKTQLEKQRQLMAKMAALNNRSLKSRKDIDQQHQRNITNNINGSILPFLHNINHHSALSPQQIEEIQMIAKMPKEQFINNASTCLNQADLWKIVALISDFNERSGKKIKFRNSTKLAKNNHFYHEKFTKTMLISLERINPTKNARSNYFYVVKLFYSKLQEQNLYYPPAKRFLMGVLQMIENSSLIKNKIYLRAALRIFENQETFPSELAQNLAKTKPVRCNEFVMSQESYVKNEIGDFIPAYIVQGQTIRAINAIHRSIKRPTYPRIFQFVKLSHHSRCKTITITISGFLSQYSDKDQEWMQLIHALRSSEIYSLRWKSSSRANLAAYILTLPLSFLPIDLPKNPFTQAWTEAEVVGIYLAQILMHHFEGRFINLVGFSLGTRVIQHCLLHLLKKKRTNLINRVVTMGGVANSLQIYQMLSLTNYPLQWINLWSERDYIVRYLLKFWSFRCCPIGEGDIKAVDGHDVINVNLTSQVQGHMDFINHHFCFGKMLDLYHN